MNSEGSMVHYLKFQVKKWQRSSLIFAIINSAHFKTVPTLSHEAVFPSVWSIFPHYIQWYPMAKRADNLQCLKDTYVLLAREIMTSKTTTYTPVSFRQENYAFHRCSTCVLLEGHVRWSGLPSSYQKAKELLSWTCRVINIVTSQMHMHIIRRERNCNIFKVLLFHMALSKPYEII